MEIQNTFQISMIGMDLDQLVQRIPRTPGRYHIIISRHVAVEAKRLFDYDAHRHPPHPHFVAYGKPVFGIDYIGHYLLPNIENKNVMERYDDLDIHLLMYHSFGLR